MSPKGPRILNPRASTSWAIPARHLIVVLAAPLRRTLDAPATMASSTGEIPANSGGKCAWGPHFEGIKRPASATGPLLPCSLRQGGFRRFSAVPALEASTLTHAQRRGLFARRSPLLRFQDDEKLVALTRRGHQHAFDTLVERYQSRLLGFCRQMLGSTEDAEDVLQEVFVAAYNAMVADERPIAVRPWLYRIARNRCLNHLRKPTADGQDTMDTHPHMNGGTTRGHVKTREEFRTLLSDVGNLPETQRSALLLREVDAMSYEEIAQAMDTTVPGIKSLLVRARIALAESSQ